MQLSEDQRTLVATVRDFVKREVMPAATELELADEYPHALVAQMRELGFFGATIPEEYGGSGVAQRPTPCSSRNCPRAG